MSRIGWAGLAVLACAGCLPNPWNHTLYDRALEGARVTELDDALADLKALEPHLDEDASTAALECIDASVRARHAWSQKQKGAFDIAVKIPGGWQNVPIDVGLPQLRAECARLCTSSPRQPPEVSRLEERHRASCAGAELDSQLTELERGLKGAHDAAGAQLHVSLWKQLRAVDALVAQIGSVRPDEPAVARAKAEVETLRSQHREALARVERFEGDADVIRLLHQLAEYEREMRLLETSGDTSTRADRQRELVSQEVRDIRRQLTERARALGLDAWE